MSIIFVAFVISLIGIVFLVWAMYLAFKSLVSPALAALISGTLTIFVASLLILSTKIIVSQREKKRRARKVESKENYDEILKELEIAKKHPFLTTITALTIGFFVGNSPSARETLAESLVLFLREKVVDDQQE